MASASSPTISFTGHLTPPDVRWRLLSLAAGGLAVFLMLFQGGSNWPRPWLMAYSIAGIAALALLVYLHLKSVASGHAWIAFLPCAIALELSALVWQTSPRFTVLWMEALGCGLFMYLMIWSLAACQNEGALQPLATGALMLSCGVLAKPATALSGALLSLIFFVLRGRSGRGGIVNFALLLFTPAILCALALLVVNWVSGPVTRGWNPSPSGLPDEFSLRFTQDAALLAGLRSGFAFSLAVLIARMLERKTSAVDASFAILWVFLEVAGTADWMPVPLGTAELAVVTFGGGASLLALSPPVKWPGRLVVLLGTATPIFFQWI
jgi:hypothetical protein